LIPFKRGQATFLDLRVDAFSFRLIVIVAARGEWQSQAVIRKSGIILFYIKKVACPHFIM
jgi:hypothetical protein